MPCFCILVTFVAAASINGLGVQSGFMRKFFKFLVFILVVVGAVAVYSYASGPSTAQFKTLGEKYDVKILRDTWGVPHIFGKRDADTAFGLAYAHAEDDMPTILEALLAARGLT